MSRFHKVSVRKVAIEGAQAPNLRSALAQFWCYRWAATASFSGHWYKNYRKAPL